MFWGPYLCMKYIGFVEVSMIYEFRLPSNFFAGRPKAALLFWFFGDFRCGALLFMIIWLFTLYINIKIGKNSC